MARRTRKRVKLRTSSSVRLGVLITVLTLIVIAAGVLMAPVFNVIEVYCEGSVNVKTEDIISAAQIENGKHILLVNIGKAERNTEDIPLVKEAKIRRVFPNKICISINERIPVSYVMRGDECIVFDDEGVVLEVINDGRAPQIAGELKPLEDINKQENNSEETKEKKSENSDTEEDKSDTEENSDKETDDAAENTEENIVNEEAALDKPFNIPLSDGIEIDEAEAGKKLKIKDEEKFNKLMELTRALMNSQLLERTTYIDISNLSDIRIIIEKRLDIYIGGLDNVEYRTKFLSEVINTKISSYENAVMDYRGDDIFVRPPEDGKDRVIKSKKDEKTDEEEEKENSDDSSEESEEDTSEEISDDEPSQEEEDTGDNQSSMSIEE